MKAKGKGELITYQISRLGESLRNFDIKGNINISKSYIDEKINLPQDLGEEKKFIKLGVIPSKEKIQIDGPFMDKIRLTPLQEESLFEKLHRKSRFRDIAESEMSPRSPKSIMKKKNFPEVSPFEINPVMQIQEDKNLQKLQLKSQFDQRNKMKKISNILAKSDIENKRKAAEEKTPLLKNISKSKSNLEDNKNNKVSEKALNIKLKNSASQENQEEKLRNIPKQPNTIIVEKEQIDNKDNKVSSFNQISEEEEEFNFNHLLFHKIQNFGDKKIDFYYEVVDEIPFLKYEDMPIDPKLVPKQKTIIIEEKQEKNDKYEEEIDEINSSMNHFLLKFNKFLLNFKKNQNKESIKDFFDEIYENSLKNIQGRLLIYSIFNLFVCLAWIILRDSLVGLEIFTPLRLLTVLAFLISIKVLTYNKFRANFKKLIFGLYALTLLQILLFTNFNNKIEIVMELEILACYLSLTNYPFVMFLETVLISIIFFILHGIYLKIVENPNFLMLHSSAALIFFNLLNINTNIKASLENFNHFRVNIIKKKQLNNLIANLLPNHVRK